MLLAGTYEKLVYAYKIKPTKNDSQTGALTLTKHFTYLAGAPITCAAAAGPISATGSSDDTIHCYDMPSLTHIGVFHNHPATPTALGFYTPHGLSCPRNFISGASDGSICIFDADPFVHLKTVEVHRRAVNDVAVHPSGQLALSVGADKCLAITNLVRGRRSFFGGLGKEGTSIKLNDDAEKFFVAKDGNVGVHSMEDAKLITELACPKRVLSIATGEHDLLFTGGEDRNITAWDINSGKVAYCVEGAHASRIKGIVVLTRSGGPDDDDHPYFLASGSSDGVIRVWDVRKARKEKPSPLAEVDTKSRLTCIAGNSFKSYRQPGTGKVIREDHDESVEKS